MAATFAAEKEPEWEKLSDTSELTIYQRSRPGSTLLEYQAVGIVAVPPLVVERVLDDSDEYPNFMPYVSECKVLSRSGPVRVGYQRLSFPIVGDRDYTLRIRTSTERHPQGGLVYLRIWNTANDLGPAEISGVTRVKISEGSWRLEPSDGGKKTRAIYRLFSDPGGNLPAMILNTANKTALPKLFEALRKQAQVAKYHVGLGQ